MALTHIFNSLCNDHTHVMALGECPDNGAGIWARPAVVQDPVTGHIFFTTSDGYLYGQQGRQQLGRQRDRDDARWLDDS